MINHYSRYVMIALLTMGSAILLFSCKETAVVVESYDEMLMTEYSDSLEIIMSESGIRSYHLEAPLMEGYSLAKEPYREFRKGIKITTYQEDSTSIVDVILTSNYAIYYVDLELWETKGNVVVLKADGSALYTEQLFWNARTQKIYSNVDSDFIQKKDSEGFVVEGFESDDKFDFPKFRRIKGVMRVSGLPTQDKDTTNVAPNPPLVKEKPEGEYSKP